MLIALLSPGDQIPKTPEIPFKDKIVHFGLFFVLNILWLRVQNRNKCGKNFIRKFFTIYLVFGVLIAILVEYLQLYVPNRSFDYQDITANILGGTVGIICFYILYKKESKLV
ncbi:VanZ like family protein [Belliella buryatensis]|uniref:VanZ like family protein n=2 Tax=Belliella buryatensis TaxID=1500549 RepID=A0A239FYH5_9BACT|nr:VanZ like family protein [Belliella buryatensis]